MRSSQKDHRSYGCIIIGAFRSETEMAWKFIRVYHKKERYMATWRYEISQLELKNISLCAHS